MNPLWTAFVESGTVQAYLAYKGISEERKREYRFDRKTRETDA